MGKQLIAMTSLRKREGRIKEKDWKPLRPWIFFGGLFGGLGALIYFTRPWFAIFFALFGAHKGFRLGKHSQYKEASLLSCFIPFSNRYTSFRQSRPFSFVPTICLPLEAPISMARKHSILPSPLLTYYFFYINPTTQNASFLGRFKQQTGTLFAHL